MNTIDRDAQLLYDQLMSGRQATFTSTPEHKRDVLVRLHQMLRGDLDPSYGDPNDG